MLFTFLLVVHAIVAATLVTVVLMQKSEGGGLGMGGSPSGLMSARGAADFLTRATTVLATLFIGMSILLAVLAASRNTTATVDPTLARHAPETTSIPTQAPPAGTAPFAGGAGAAVAPANAAAAANGNSSVPLAQ